MFTLRFVNLSSRQCGRWSTSEHFRSNFFQQLRARHRRHADQIAGRIEFDDVRADDLRCVDGMNQVDDFSLLPASCFLPTAYFYS